MDFKLVIDKYKLIKSPILSDIFYDWSFQSL